MEAAIVEGKGAVLGVYFGASHWN